MRPPSHPDETMAQRGLELVVARSVERLPQAPRLPAKIEPAALMHRVVIRASAEQLNIPIALTKVNDLLFLLLLRTVGLEQQRLGAATVSDTNARVRWRVVTFDLA